MNYSKLFIVSSVLALPALLGSGTAVADTATSISGIYCQPRDSSRPVARDPASGITNLQNNGNTLDTAYFDCPVPINTTVNALHPAAVRQLSSVRVSYVEDSVGNLRCVLVARDHDGFASGTTQQLVAPTGASTTPAEFVFTALQVPANGFVDLHCDVPQFNGSVPSGLISYSFTQE